MVGQMRVIYSPIYKCLDCGILPLENANPGSQAASGICLLCGGRRTRTSDLWVMSPTSYHCSIPRYILLNFLEVEDCCFPLTCAKVRTIFELANFITGFLC